MWGLLNWFGLERTRIRLIHDKTAFICLYDEKSCTKKSCVVRIVFCKDKIRGYLMQSEFEVAIA